MKRESRILFSSQHGGWVVGVVARGESLDGVVVSTSCAGLCLRLSELGYMGELRYSVGPCTCGLPRPPGIPRGASKAGELARLAAEAAARLAELVGKMCGSGSSNR